jgi:hypothetical protein
LRPPIKAHRPAGAGRGGDISVGTPDAPADGQAGEAGTLLDELRLASPSPRTGPHQRRDCRRLGLPLPSLDTALTHSDVKVAQLMALALSSQRLCTAGATLAR